MKDDFRDYWSGTKIGFDYVRIPKKALIALIIIGIIAILIFFPIYSTIEKDSKEYTNDSNYEEYSEGDDEKIADNFFKDIGE